MGCGESPPFRPDLNIVRLVAHPITMPLSPCSRTNERFPYETSQAQTRIATFLTLRPTPSSTPPSPSSPGLREDRDLIHLVNTHYDDQGKKSRGKASLLIRGLMRGWVEINERKKDHEPAEEEGLVIWMGDFSTYRS